MTYCKISNLSFHYANGKHQILHNFSLQLEKGESVGVIGPSGCGKSTLLRLIAGLEAPSSGQIMIGGRTMVDAKTFVNPEARDVGVVFQDYGLFPHMTVERNIAFGLHQLSRKAREARLKEMLELVKLEDYRKRYPHELSGGQQQRVAFARALAPEPALLLMDEPFSNLDTNLRGEIRAELRQLLSNAGITSILVTHDKEDADAICNRIVTISSSVENIGCVS